MNRELNVKLKLDNSSYLEAMQEIIDRTSMFKDEIDRVKDKLNELSSIKIETKINHNIDETINKIKEAIDRVKELKENSVVTIDIQNKVGQSKEEDNKYKDMARNTKDSYGNFKTVYDNTIGLAKKDDENRNMLTRSFSSEKKSEEAMQWISSQNSSIAEDELVKGIIQANNAGLDYKRVVAAAADTSAGTGKGFSEVMDTVMKVNAGRSDEVTDQIISMGISKEKSKKTPGITDKQGEKIDTDPKRATYEVVNSMQQRYKGVSNRGKIDGVQGTMDIMQNTGKNVGKVLRSGSNNNEIIKTKGNLKNVKTNSGVKELKNMTNDAFKTPKNMKSFVTHINTGFKQILDISKGTCGGIIKSIGEVSKMILTSPITPAIAVVIVAITAIIGIVKLLQKAWNENWGGIKDKLEPTVNAIKGFIDSISPPIEKVIGVIGKFLGKVLDAWKAVTDFLSNPVQGVIDIAAKFIGNGEGKGKAGKNALGTSYWNGGMTWVGENGPELIDLPSGAQVFDSRTSRNMMGNNFSIPKLADTIIVREDADIDRIANALARKLKTTSINMA